MAALALLILHGWPAPEPRGTMVTAAYLAGLALFALLAIGCAFRLVAVLPIIEASELGIAIWFHGPYRRPFFAPWNRVRAIVLTQVARPPGATRTGRREALGIEFVQDDQFRIPDLRNRPRTREQGAPQATLAWSDRAIGGDLREWVELLQKMRSTYGEPVA